MRKTKIRMNKTAYQQLVSATEFRNNKVRKLFDTFFFLKAYQNPYVKHQLNNNGFTQRRRLLLTWNRAAFYDQPVLSYGNYWVLDKKRNTNVRRLSKSFL